MTSIIPVPVLPLLSAALMRLGILARPLAAPSSAPPPDAARRSASATARPRGAPAFRAASAASPARAHRAARAAAGVLVALVVAACAGMTPAGATPADAPAALGSLAASGAPAAPAALTASVAWETDAVMRDVAPSWHTRAVAGTGGPMAAAPAGRWSGGRGRYSWPTGGPAPVVEGFDPPAVVWGRGHRGVDLAAPEGSQVRSAGDGVVAFAGVVAGRPVVSVDHADGIRTTYEPVEPAVSAGRAVARGEVIGTLLAGHRDDGVSALHWGARTGPKTYVNPLRLLQPPVIRLKPAEG